MVFFGLLFFPVALILLFLLLLLLLFLLLLLLLLLLLRRRRPLLFLCFSCLFLLLLIVLSFLTQAGESRNRHRRTARASLVRRVVADRPQSLSHMPLLLFNFRQRIGIHEQMRLSN